MLKLFLDSRSGSTLPVFAVSIAVLLTTVGAGIDLTMSFANRQELQVAADRAALAGAVYPGSDTDKITEAKRFFEANRTDPSVVPSVAIVSGVLRVSATGVTPNVFGGLLGLSGYEYIAKAEAVISSTSTCILLLEPTDRGLLANSGGKLDADCGVHVNSSHSTEAIFVNSDSSIKATSVKVNGKARLNSGGVISPTAITRAAPMADPFASVPIPPNAAGPCDYVDFVINSGETKVMKPGIYCKTTLINSGGKANMEKGLYIFRNGPFIINSHSSAQGTDVTFYFHDKDAYLNVNSGGKLQASAPTAGDMKGILLFQNRGKLASGAQQFIINSESTTTLTGALYLPKSEIVLNSNSTGNIQAPNTTIVARKMLLNSAGTFYVRSDFSTIGVAPAMAAVRSGTNQVHLVR